MLKRFFSDNRIKFHRLLPLGAVLTGAAVFLLTLTAGAYLEAAPVYDDTLRLHIRAASDSAEDQALKLLVRDRLTGVAASLTKDASDAGQAADIMREHLALVCEQAQAVLRENGCDAGVAAAVKKEYFNTRSYPSSGGVLTLPAGKYTALVVTIGEGSGHNWWCVLYPSLCLPAAAGEDQCKALSLYTESEQQLVLGEYRLKFWLLEAAAQLHAWLEGETLYRR